MAQNNNIICKVCKNPVSGKEDRIRIRKYLFNTFTQTYHLECFESVAGEDFSNSISKCAICEQNVQTANSRGTICKSCSK